MSTITIYGEASWSPHTQAAGWAAYCERDGKAILPSGPYGYGCAHSQQAEFMALANGLMAALKAGMLDGASGVTLESDCMEVLSTLRWAVGADGPNVPLARRPSAPMRDHESILTIAALVRPLGCPVSVRHAKGLPGREALRRECRALARAERVLLEAEAVRPRRCS